MTNRDKIAGCLIGIAVGDSLGLPMERLSRQTIALRFPPPVHQRLIGSWGMCSDDTEHAFLVAQAILASGGNAERFERRLARGLRWWFAALPAGIGRATLRSCMKLWLGWPARSAGVASAGNGSAMRAPLIGAIFANNPEQRQAFTRASSHLTHHDALAALAADTIAELAAALREPSYKGQAWLDGQLNAMPADAPDNWRASLSKVANGLARDHDLDRIATDLGLGERVTGWSLHTAPMVIAAVIRHLDQPAEAIEGLIRCGGDTDTTAAIAGGLLGIRHGPDCWPDHWLRDIHNGPLSLERLHAVADQLADDNGKPVRWWWPLVPFRNAAFLLIVLAHGFRRLAADRLTASKKEAYYET